MRNVRVPSVAIHCQLIILVSVLMIHYTCPIV